MPRPDQRCDCSECNGALIPYDCWARHAQRRLEERQRSHLSYVEFLQQKAQELADNVPQSGGPPGIPANKNANRGEEIPRTQGELTLDGTEGMQTYSVEPQNEDRIILENDSINDPHPLNEDEFPNLHNSSRRSSRRSSFSSRSSSYADDQNPLPSPPSQSNPRRDDEITQEMREALEQLRLLEQREPHPEPIDDDNDPQAPIPEMNSRIESIRITQEFIRLIRAATLDDGHCPEEVINRLRKPLETPVDISDPSIRLAIDTYLATSNASDDTYTAFREAYKRKHPDEPFKTHKEIKSLVEEITGIVSVWYDMCINSCIGYTGLFRDLENCWKCNESRYDPVELERSGRQIARLQFTDTLRYRALKIAKVQEILQESDNNLESEFIWDNHACGQAFREMVEKLMLTEDDQIFTITMDSFQMSKNKKSDTWIAMLISEDFSPENRIRKHNLFPAFMVPGPNKIKHADSFLFPLLHHISALQKENSGRGFMNWSATKKAIIYTHPVIAFATADRVGLAEIDGRVGHHGALGCRSDCPMKGRHKPDSGHYYSAHL
ncbi:hypothetical protein AAF712_016754 [Marasmius tenuissimus]|uniref:Transposase n=1 Tax=Marasmius tenuissimus TaxID=585030 RepID=A0ABR2Z525_9AGAR